MAATNLDYALIALEKYATFQDSGHLTNGFSFVADLPPKKSWCWCCHQSPKIFYEIDVSSVYAEVILEARPTVWSDYELPVLKNALKGLQLLAENSPQSNQLVNAISRISVAIISHPEAQRTPAVIAAARDPVAR